MKKENGESEFLDKVRARLNDSADNLDGRTLARLRQARRNALDYRSNSWRDRWQTYRLYLAAGSAAAVVLFFTLINFQSPSEPQYYGSLEDIELLATGDGLEFYTDLDFYTWLAEEMDNAG